MVPTILINQEMQAFMPLGERRQIVFNEGSPNEIRDYYFPQFRVTGTAEQWAALQKCYSENVVNIIGPVQNDSPEAKMLEAANFDPSWHGTGQNKRKYYKNALATKKIYYQNGDLVIGANLVITIDIWGKRGAIIVNDPSKGSNSMMNVSGLANAMISPDEPVEKVLSKLYKISIETACREGKEEVGITVEKNQLQHLLTWINKPIFKEIVGELNSEPQTCNGPSQVSMVWQAHFINDHALELLKSINISEVEFNNAFKGDGDFIFKKHVITGNKEIAEYEEVLHHIFVPEKKLRRSTCQIEELQGELKDHHLVFIQTALKIERTANWDYLALIADAAGNILHEKEIPKNSQESEGMWLINFKKIKKFISTLQTLSYFCLFLPCINSELN